jgi:hypothetical protein
MHLERTKHKNQTHAGKLAYEGDGEIGNYFDSPWPGGSKKAAPASAQDASANKEPAK